MGVGGKKKSNLQFLGHVKSMDHCCKATTHNMVQGLLGYIVYGKDEHFDEMS